MPFATLNDIVSWVGARLSPASNTAGDGTQVGPVVRAIQRKYISISTSALLPANATFTSAWMDTQASGSQFILAQSFSNVASGGQGFTIQGTNDVGNPNLFQSIGIFAGATSTTSGGVAANNLANIIAFCPFRYYRVIYVNGAAAQSSFELSVIEQDMPPGMMMGGNAVGSTGTSGPNYGMPFGASMVGVDPLSGSVHVSQNLLTGASATDLALNIGAFALNNTPFALAVMMNGVTNGDQNNNNVRIRVPQIFLSSQFSGTGSNTIWQPGSTKKTRLMKYKIEVSADATIAGGAAPINLQFNQQLGTAQNSLFPYGTMVPYTHRLVLPSAAQSAFEGWDSGWIDLGNGVLGPTAGRALQMGIQVPQSTAAITSPTWTIASNQWEAATVGFKTSGNTGTFKLIQTTSAASGTASLNLPIIKMVTGNAYFVFFRTLNGAGGAPTVVVTDTALNTYTTGTLVTNASDGTNGSSIGVAYVVNAVGNQSNLLTITTSVNAASLIQGIAVEYAGLGSGGIDAAQVSATGNSTSPASGNYTPATAGDLVLTFMATAAALAVVPTPPAAFTLRGVPSNLGNGALSFADNFGNGSLATGQINVIAIGTEE